MSRGTNTAPSAHTTTDVATAIVARRRHHRGTTLGADRGGDDDGAGDSGSTGTRCGAVVGVAVDGGAPGRRAAAALDTDLLSSPARRRSCASAVARTTSLFALRSWASVAGSQPFLRDAAFDQVPHAQ